MRVLVQGATGREGQRAIAFMRQYGTEVVAGVTPGKGGQEVAGVPVFNSVREALRAVGKIGAASQYVPPFAVAAAVAEAAEAGIPFVHVLTEGVPLKDLAQCVASCRQRGVRLLGPGSLGMLVVGEGRIGMLGGLDPRAYPSGTTSVISRSGGMANEIARYLAEKGNGLRAVVHLGAEPIAGASLTDALEMLISDPGTARIVVFEEQAGADSTLLFDFGSRPAVSKPVLLSLVGVSSSALPEGAPFGHADALLGHAARPPDPDALRRAGIMLVDSYEAFAADTSRA